MVQVICPLAEAVAPGGAMSCATLTEPVAVQPFVTLVSKKIYVPGAFTVGVNVLAPVTILPLVVVHW